MNNLFTISNIDFSENKEITNILAKRKNMRRELVFLKTTFTIADLTRNLKYKYMVFSRLRVDPAMTALWMLLLMANFAFGQNDYTPIKPPIYIDFDWSREHFIKNEVNTISVYSYHIDENGTIKDSFQFHISHFDVHENKIWGTRYGFIHVEAYYNADGQAVKYGKITEEDTNLNDTGKYLLVSESAEYEYDSLNREIKTTEQSVHRNYFKDNKKLFSQAIFTKIKEFAYNSNNQKIECYKTDNTQITTYLKAKKRIKTKSNASYYNPKHLIYQWKYDSLSNVTEWISISEFNFFYKRNYSYDNQNRFVKQIDSTNRNYSKRITTCEYTDTGKIVTEIHYKNKDTINYTTISHYNNDDKIVKSCYSRDSEYRCIEDFYFYENEKLTKEIKQNSLGNVFVTTYSYNEKGLLKEIQEFSDDKITNLIRYYYE